MGLAIQSMEVANSGILLTGGCDGGLMYVSTWLGHRVPI